MIVLPFSAMAPTMTPPSMICPAMVPLLTVMPPGLIVPELIMSPLNEVSLKVHEARVWPAELMKLVIVASRRRHPPPGLTPARVAPPPPAFSHRRLQAILLVAYRSQPITGILPINAFNDPSIELPPWRLRKRSSKGTSDKRGGERFEIGAWR